MSKRFDMIGDDTYNAGVHHIQQKILSLLLHSPSLGYAQLRPKGIESNHFAYHLEQLVHAGLIGKEDRKYFLTAEGLALADRVSHESLTVRKQPHIVTTVQVTNDAGKVALFRHNFQPYIGRYGFPQGRLHYGERVAEAAARELAEKTGLQNAPLAHRGIVYIRTSKNGSDISEILSHIFTAEIGGEPELLSEDPKKGESFWGNLADYTTDLCMPGVHQIRDLLAGNTGLFFAEIEATL